jgi:hypothetical protein
MIVIVYLSEGTTGRRRGKENEKVNNVERCYLTV